MIELYKQPIIRIDDDAKDDIINAFANFGFYLMFVLHDKKKIDLFSVGLKDLIITLLYFCKSELQYGTFPKDTTIEQMREQLQRNGIVKIDWLSNILRNEYKINVAEEDLKQGYIF